MNQAVRIVLSLNALLLVALPIKAFWGRSDLAGDGMAMAYAVILAVVGAVVWGGLALGWRVAVAGWARTTLAGLIVLMTLILLAVLLA